MTNSGIRRCADIFSRMRGGVPRRGIRSARNACRAVPEAVYTQGAFRINLFRSPNILNRPPYDCAGPHVSTPHSALHPLLPNRPLSLPIPAVPAVLGEFAVTVVHMGVLCVPCPSALNCTCADATPPNAMEAAATSITADSLIFPIPPLSQINFTLSCSGQEFHPSAHRKPDVSLSTHPASTFQPTVGCRAATRRAGSELALRAVPASVWRQFFGVAAACISISPIGRAPH